MITSAGLESLDALYAAIKPLSMTAGWMLQTSSRTGSYQPAHWEYSEAHAALEAAGRLVDTNLAERRNLVMLNPGGGHGTASTLVTAYQMIMPGERARSHRHTANALRLVVDALPGAYTIVDGTRLDMLPGDVVLTPNWCWHGHANEGVAAAYWLDYLDVPVAVSLGQMVFQEYPNEYETVRETRRDSPYVYPWEESKAAMAQAPFDPQYGRKIVLDRFQMKTIGLSMSALDAGTRTAELRTPINHVYSVVSGTGHSMLGDRTVEWARGDVFVAPARCAHHHEATSDAVLFCVTDEPLLAAIEFQHP